MQRGDGLILALSAISIALLVLDGLTGGAIAAWFNAHLPGIAQWIGGKLVLVARYIWPLLGLPLVYALIGRFTSPPVLLETILRRSIGVFERLTCSIGGAARWLALGLVIATVTIVIQRYVFGTSSTKLAESVIYMHALLFLLAAPLTLLADGHVRVDIFYSKASERGKAWIDLLGTYLALMPMAALILISSTGYMNSTWRILERSRESDGLPFVFLLKTAIPLFALLLIFQGFAMAARAALKIANKDVPPVPETLAEPEV